MPLAFAVSGMTSLALEVIWFRMLVLYFPATTYAFTAMLASVLGGIAAGSLIVSPVLRRLEPTVGWFGVLQGAVGMAAVLGFMALAANYRADWAMNGLVPGAALSVVPAAVLMGAAFPVGIRICIPSAARAGATLGRLYGVNLLGAIAGSMAAGFLLLPRFGTATSLEIVAGANVVMGVLLSSVRGRTSRGASMAAAVLVIAFVVATRNLPDPVTTGMTKRYPDAGRIFFRDEGVQTTVSVHVRELGGRQLYLDGLHQASDGYDVVRLHRQIGHLPVLLHPAPRRALVIGLGGGATAGAVSVHSGLRVDVVELAPGVVKAAEWFSHVNEDVLGRANVRLRVDDARNYLLLGTHHYDVITADIIQPTHAGAGLLYSREYFDLARRALADGGVMVQWIGPRSETHYKLIARTFQSVFPETTAWVGGSLLIGSARPLAVDRAALARRFAAIGRLPSLDAAGFGDAAAVMRHFTAGPSALRRFVGDGPLLTDDRPMLEYFLSLPRNEPPIDLGGLR
jgi:spermidine synthase